MFENICSLPLTSDLFALALHPTSPILSVGLSAGHVHTYRLPDATDVSASSSPEPTAAAALNTPVIDGIPRRSSLRRTSIASAASDSGFGVVETMWRTRRHKGSCRVLAFSPDGEYLFSAGSDGLVKAARTADGRVVAKIAVPLDENGEPDPPCALDILMPNHLILSTDSSAVHIYSLTISSSPSSCTISPSPTTTHHPHSSFLSSLTPLPLPATSTSTTGYPKQFLSTGGTTLAVTDLYRGILVVSSPQDFELTSSIFVSGLHRGGTSQGAKVVVGDSTGALSLWERGVWDDLDERIIVDKINNEAIESLTTVPDNAVSRPQGEHKLVACGLGDGKIRFVRLGINKVLRDWDLQHDEIEGVVALGFDIGGRLVSGGGETVKLWRQKMPGSILTPKPNGISGIFGAGHKHPREGDPSRDSNRGDQGGEEDDDDGDDDGEQEPGNDAYDETSSSASDSNGNSASNPSSKRRRKKRKRGAGKNAATDHGISFKF